MSTHPEKQYSICHPGRLTYSSRNNSGLKIAFLLGCLISEEGARTRRSLPGRLGMPIETQNRFIQHKGFAMSIITISRGSYSYGKEVAEKVARRLGYECIARDVLIEASEEYDIPEIKLLRAMQYAPSFLDRFTPEKEKYVTYIQAAILRHLCKDNVVYHGLAGQFFVRGVSHVLKVRIIADLEDRVKLVMERDRVSNKDARRFLKKVDDQRRKWSQHLYGIDTSDPSLYDLVLHIRKITVDEAADIIAHTVAFPHFRATPESQCVIEDLALAAEVKSVLIDLSPDVEVTTHNGMAHVRARIATSAEMEMVQEIERVVREVPGVRGVRVEVLPSALYTG